MTTSYTSLLGFALPQTGDLSGTWGDVVNASITQLVEDSVAGVATTSVASGDWTLTTTGSGADNQARKAILIPTGSSGTTRNINAPKSSKAYFVINNSTGSVVVRGGPTSPTTGVTITAGSRAVVAWNGSDFVNLTPTINWSIKTTTYTAVAGDALLANTTSGAFTITLPASASISDTISIADYAGTFATNNLTVNSNSLNLMGSVQTLILDVNYRNVTLVYSGATEGWVITL